jgi:protein involved in polysaccharide export with SLBB domain
VQQRQFPFGLVVTLLQPGDDRAGEAAADAGGIRQQVTQRHRAIRRSGRVRTVDRVEMRDDTQAIEAGRVSGNGIVQRQLALLQQHHDRHARPRGRGLP